ncbi:hypothetical protein ABI59_17820 [Acidobacteria bacterium Mor1]|nr:hypothetical protein ABI59_17820 [Acidobacteria bacterium Mor1]
MRYRLERQRSSTLLLITCMLLCAWLGASAVQAQPAMPTAVASQPYSQLFPLCNLTGGGVPGDITIPDDGTIYQISSTTTCGLIRVEGVLECAPGVTATLNADGILVTGPNARLQCGSPSNRFDGKLIFNIRNDRSFPGMSGNERMIMAMNGGTISLHGGIRKARITRLNADAQKNSSSFSVLSAGSWQDKDPVLLTTTSTYPDQNELHTLSGDCVGNACSTNNPLQYFHYGDGTQTYLGAGTNGQDLTVDMRGYAANLRRNIRIRGANDGFWQNQMKGAHVMAMAGTEIYIDGVEFNRVGQLGILGRYPFHWHHAGNVNGQYVRNSSIRNSGSRCIALHNTHKAKVTNNVCYNVQGHAIFLEEGNEVENVITDNLIVNVNEPPAGQNLLQSDIDVQLSRWRGSAGIWISNPDNTIDDNVVVDAGTGYWHAYVHNLFCYDDPADQQGTANPDYGKYCNWIPRQNPGQSNVNPVRTRTLSYADNVAYSCRIGHTWDGAPDGAQTPGSTNPFDRDLIVTGYAPRDDQGALTQELFEGMHAYKSGKTAIYYRGLASTALIQNAVVAEAPMGWFGTGQQDFWDSLFVGISANFDGTVGGEDFHYHADTSFPLWDRHGNGQLMAAVGLYDGPNHFKNVTYDYPVGPMFLDDGDGNKEVTPTPFRIFGRAHFANHVVEQLHFTQNPYRRINLDAQAFPINWKDVEASESVFDADGSLFGNSGFIRSDIPFVDTPGDCMVGANVAPNSTVLICKSKTMSVKFQMDQDLTIGNLTPDFQKFRATRLDTDEWVEGNGNVLFDKFQTHINAALDVTYEVSDLNFKSGGVAPYPDGHSGNLVWIESFNVGDWSPVILIDGASATNLASSCATPADYRLAMWPGWSGQIHEATSSGEIRSFNNPNFAGAFFRVPNGSLALKLKGTATLPGNMDPAVFHTGHTKFDLICDTP